MITPVTSYRVKIIFDQKAKPITFNESEVVCLFNRKEKGVTFLPRPGEGSYLFIQRMNRL